jgi:hypothetical protein
MQQLIDTDPLPLHGSTPHPMPSPPLHWLELGTPPLPRRDQGNDQKGSRSCVLDRADHMVQEVQLSHQAMHIPVNQVVLGPTISRQIVTGPARPPSTMVRLNFEVFAYIYQYCAYDSSAFIGFFSSLSNVILGRHGNADLEFDPNPVYEITQQAKSGGRRTCVVQEF